MRALAIIAGLGILAGCATAPSSDGALAANSDEQVICRMKTRAGSIIPDRTCHTESEWAAIDQAERERVDEIEQDIQSGQFVRP